MAESHVAAGSGACLVNFYVIELNGAVDFGDHYSFAGRNVFADAMGALAGRRPHRVVEAAAAVPS